LLSVKDAALGKVFFKKIKKILCQVQDYSTRQRIFKKKRKKSLPSAANVALGKEAIRVDGGFFFAEC
jgi:hypothetical protein